MDAEVANNLWKEQLKAPSKDKERKKKEKDDDDDDD